MFTSVNWNYILQEYRKNGYKKQTVLLEFFFKYFTWKVDDDMKVMKWWKVTTFFVLIFQQIFLDANKIRE